MKLSDFIEQSFLNLWKMKLRTFLTTSGVVIGIAALVAMVSYGKGIQKNINDRFQSLELFNYLTVFDTSLSPFAAEVMDNAVDSSVEETAARAEGKRETPALDDSMIAEIMKMAGVKAVFPEIRFPAVIRLGQEEVFTLIQVLPASVSSTSLMELLTGVSYTSDDEKALIISDSILRRLKIDDPNSVLGLQLKISTIQLDLSFLNPFSSPSAKTGKRLPFASQTYELPITGVAARMGFGGSGLLRSDVYISPGAASEMKTLPISSLFDLFKSSATSSYSLVMVRAESAAAIHAVQQDLEELGFNTFALLDQLEELKTGFLFMDMILAAIGMVAIVVASLGIVNTMVMSILERYKEIGIMKAVGATNRDVKKIFFFETSMIGFMGGVVGLVFGWSISLLINQIVNHFLAKQGVPYIEFFSFPWWLCLGAILFAVLVSLVAGIYPAVRAARVDPVVALRRD